MSKVQLDDYECPTCNKIGIGELNIKTGDYISHFCNCDKENGKEL